MKWIPKYDPGEDPATFRSRERRRSTAPLRVCVCVWGDNTLLHKDKDLSTNLFFIYKSVPDDNHSNTQHVNQEYNISAGELSLRERAELLVQVSTKSLIS